MTAPDSSKTVVILNPESGRGKHVETVRDRSDRLGYTVVETEAPGDSLTLAREAADGDASTVVAAGGDGTLNEVLRGIDEADAFDRVTAGVIPVGTGNNFAQNIGITGIGEAFAALEDGERRWIDIGRANDRLFVNSCIAGLTADSSSETSSEMKRRFGVVAYVLTTLRSLSTFEGLRLSVNVFDDGTETTVWTGDAVVVLIGNGRRFAPRGRDQANMEDGLLDVTIIADVPSIDLVGDRVLERLFGQESDYITRMRTPALEVEVQAPEVVRFSLDGETIQRRTLSLRTQPRSLRMPVGNAYDPDPD